MEIISLHKNVLWNNDDINTNENNENLKEIFNPEITSSNLNIKRNYSLNKKNSNHKSRQHYSIDCNSNLFKSNESIGSRN